MNSPCGNVEKQWLQKGENEKLTVNKNLKISEMQAVCGLTALAGDFDLVGI